MSEFEQEQQAKREASRWLRGFTQEARGWVLLTVTIGLLSGVLLIFQMIFLSHIAYESYIKQASRQALTLYFVGFLGLVLVRSLLNWLKEIVSFQTSIRVKATLREKLLNHINQLGPVYVGQFSTAELVSSIMEQVEGLHEFLVYYLPQMSLAVLMPIAILCFVFPINITSGVILLLCAPLIPFFMALVGMGASSLQQKHFQALSRMSVQFLDAIQGLVTLKLLGKSQQQAEQINSSSDSYRIKVMSVLKVAFMSSAVLELFSAASIALLASYLGMGFVNTGVHNSWWSFSHLTLQGALLILLLAPEFFLPLRELGTHYHAKAKAQGAAREIKKILELRPVEEVSKPKINFEANSIQLTVQSLTVRYNQQNVAALDNINLTVQANEKIAVIGPSGAGKTTLINTLLRFIDPSSGSVLINEQKLAELNEKDWYRHVSWLGQSPTLFQGTLRENLLMANQQATDEQLFQALEAVQLGELLITLPEGLETKIGEQNQGLSGGQAQRFALARAYLKDAPFLLLDEPTSSLDSENEKLVFEALQKLWQNKTVLLLTHRLEFLDQMDRVVVLDEGEIVQQGQLEELLKDKKSLIHQIYYAEQ